MSEPNAGDEKEKKLTPEQEAQKEYIARQRGEWEQYFSGLSDDYVKRVIKEAEKTTFTLSLRKTTGKKIKNPVTDEEEDEYRGWETKEYDRSKISPKEWENLDKLRALYNKEKDAEMIPTRLGKIYEYAAHVYLGMPYEDYVRSDWDEIKMTIDACNFRTAYALPNLVKTSKSSSGKAPAN